MTGRPAPARRALGALGADLARRLGPHAVALDAPLGARTTYRVGGPAGVLVEAPSEAALHEVRAALGGVVEPVAVLVLGKGSNLLVADAGFPGLVVHLGGELGDVSLPAVPPADAGGEAPPGVAPGGEEGGDGGDGAARVRAGGAAGLPVLARRSVEAGLRGLEWAVGIPGSVGGALKMNAGGHGADTASCLLRYRWVTVAPGADGNAAAGEDDAGRLRLGYRSSALGDEDVVVWAEFACRRGDPAAGRAVLAEIVRWRRAHQPGGANAGSVFANPPGGSAGALVEAAGLKGHRSGSARVSEKHANFIQADEGGRAADVVVLMRHVRAAVAASTGVVLRPEVKLVGFADDPFADDPLAGELGTGEPAAAGPGPGSDGLRRGAVP